MNRFFNTAGPCVPGEHYLLDASDRRLDVVDLIRRKQYFVIHAARGAAASSGAPSSPAPGRSTSSVRDRLDF